MMLALLLSFQMRLEGGDCGCLRNVGLKRDPDWDYLFKNES